MKLNYSAVRTWCSQGTEPLREQGSPAPKRLRISQQCGCGALPKARNITQDPADQANIPHPRLGFYGVIDADGSRTLSGIALPDWHLVIIGPVAKIDPAVLPRIHYLSKDYKELPAYLAGWIWQCCRSRQ